MKGEVAKRKLEEEEKRKREENTRGEKAGGKGDI